MRRYGRNGQPVLDAKDAYSSPKMLHALSLIARESLDRPQTLKLEIEAVKAADWVSSDSNSLRYAVTHYTAEELANFMRTKILKRSSTDHANGYNDSHNA